jgi:hypothetical protein
VRERHQFFVIVIVFSIHSYLTTQTKVCTNLAEDMGALCVHAHKEIQFIECKFVGLDSEFASCQTDIL